MVFHENYLLADDSHEISFLLSFEIRKDVTKFVMIDALRAKQISRRQKCIQNYPVGK